MPAVQVRYIVDDVDAAIAFYCRCLGFREEMHPSPAFAMLSRGELRLVLSAPNPAAGGGQPMADGTSQAPGGWNRFAIEVADLDAMVFRLRAEGGHFRNEIVTGVGGKQVIIDDPSGNPIELFQPTRPDAALQPAGRRINTLDLTPTLATLFAELVDGAPADGAYVLNRRDAGLLRSLDRLSAEDASAAVPGGGTIAAHVDHLRYGLSLMNRWSAGEDPFGDADWNASWRKTAVSEAEWQALRTALSDEAHRWLEALRMPRDVSLVELNGMAGTIAHLAYHLGAIRQINRAARGPGEHELTP